MAPPTDESSGGSGTSPARPPLLDDLDHDGNKLTHRGDGYWTARDKSGRRWEWVPNGPWEMESNDAWWARVQATRNEKQAEAVDAIRTALGSPGAQSRALVQMACGTGKTRVALMSCEAILRAIVEEEKREGAAASPSRASGGEPFIVAIFVPSIALIPQVAHEWHGARSDDFEFELVSVCSEKELEQEEKKKKSKAAARKGDDGEGDDDEAQGVSVKECKRLLPEEWRRVVHSDKEIKDYLEGPPAAGPAARRRVKLVISTYHSADLVGGRLHTMSRKATLTICDEAHLTAIKRAGTGRVDFTRPLRDGPTGVPSERRLFLTATPRLEKPTRTPKSHKDGENGAKDGLVAMDGEAGRKSYGELAFELTMADAIELELVRDYDICVVGIRPDPESEVEWLRTSEDAVAELAQSAVLQQSAQLIAVTRAMRKRDINKAFLFYSRIEDVEKAHEFANDPDRKEALFGSDQAVKLSKVHSGGKGSGPAPVRYPAPDTSTELERFRDATADELALVFNVRSLGTGINVPDARADGFMAGMGTPEGVAQAIGRVQRQCKEDGPGVKALIVLPLLLTGEEDDGPAAGGGGGDTRAAPKPRKGKEPAGGPKDKGEKGGDEKSGWSTVHNVFAALRHIDTRFCGAFRQLRTCLSIKVEAEKQRQRAAALKLIEGNFKVEMAELAENEAYREKLLGERVIEREVERTPALTWEEMYEKLKAYQAEKGNCNVPAKYAADPQLGMWVSNQKRQYRKEGHGTLAGDRLEKLRQLGAIDDWDRLAGADDAAWQEMYEKLKAYKEEKGHCNVPAKYAADPRFGTWVMVQKAQYKMEGHGTLATGGRLEKLRKLGAIDDWETAAAGRARPTKQTWEEMYEKLKAYKAEKGDCNVPKTYPADQQLSRWVNNQKAQYKKPGHGTLATGDRLEKLRQLGAIDDWEGNTDDARWQEMFEKLEAYKAEEGDCNVPARYAADPQLSRWVHRQKVQYKMEGHGWLATGDRLEKLRQLGAIADWDTAAAGRTPQSKQTWEEMFEKLKAYKAEKGDCNVPKRYATNPQLGRWVVWQRMQYNKPGHGTLATGDRLEKLRQLGAIDDWEKLAGAGDEAWQEMYAMLEKYKAEKGDCNVPQVYAADQQLGGWVQHQKKLYKMKGHGTLATGGRLEKLRELGALDDWAKVKPGRRVGGRTAEETEATETEETETESEATDATSDDEETEEEAEEEAEEEEVEAATSSGEEGEPLLVAQDEEDENMGDGDSEDDDGGEDSEDGGGVGSSSTTTKPQRTPREDKDAALSKRSRGRPFRQIPPRDLWGLALPLRSGPP